MIERLTVRNFRGREVPAVLGFALAGGGLASTLLVAAFDGVGAAGWVAAGGAALVFAAGLVDDLVRGGPRGIRAHLRGLAGGHVSPGIVKLVVIVAAAAVAVAAAPERDAVRRVAGVVLLAGAANLANALDVRPGRAIKFGILALPLVVGGEVALAPPTPGVWLAALLVLPWDAGERAMLGDAGANLLGFAIGLGAYHALGTFGVVVAAAAVVALNALAETVTLSRAIEVVPPVRWWDRLGRAPEG